MCYSIVYNYNAAQWYEQFLQLGRLDSVDWGLILLRLALSLASAPVSSVVMLLYIFFLKIRLYSSFYLSMS